MEKKQKQKKTMKVSGNHKCFVIIILLQNILFVFNECKQIWDNMMVGLFL